MNGFFNQDNPVWMFIGKFFDVMVLGIIWFLCSIPIITIGASTTAMYYSLMKLAKNEESYILKDYFHSFKQNFKQSTIIWLIFVFIGIVLIIDIFFFKNVHTTFGVFMYYLFWFVFIIYSLMLLYIFPLVAKFDNTTKNLIKFSFFMPLKHLTWTLLMIVLAVILIVSSRNFSPLVLFFPSIMLFLNSYIFVHIFDIYIKRDLKIEENNNKNLEQ